MSSSSDSEDENLKQFAAAMDTSLFNNDFYKPDEEKQKIEIKPAELKSQRYLDDTENIFQSELNVSENMKDFIGKKMSKLIDESIEFIDVKKSKNNSKEINVGIKLLKGTKDFVNLDLNDHLDYPKHKIPIKRRIIEEDDTKESLKIQAAATDIQKINSEVNIWDKRNRHETINYKKSKDDKFNLIEKPNEYSKSRNKNNWDESKIKSSKHFNKGIGALL